MCKLTCIYLEKQDLAASIQKGSLDWERALRILKHALRNSPSPGWWRRVLLVAPCHRLHAQAPTPGAVFTSEMVCEAAIERIVELLKVTNSDIISNFKLCLRLCQQLPNLYSVFPLLFLMMLLSVLLVGQSISNRMLTFYILIKRVVIFIVLCK